ncbi:MAG TPA: hypothetical protein ENK51_05120 [Gammaproteobacteria bacterium]|nr:hypothetical protein [Gammaproteobacteria bacterium]
MTNASSQFVIAAALTGLLLTGAVLADERMHHRDRPPAEEGGAGTAMPQQARLPAHYPARFDRQGIMRTIVEAGKVMIDGMRYTVSPNVRVHTLETRNASVHALRENTEVGIKLDPQGKSITAIWVLPRGSVQQN